MSKKIESLVIDQDALHLLGSAVIEPGWFDEFNWPSGETVKRVVRGGVVYLLSDKADFDSKLLVVAVGAGGVLNKNQFPQQVFDRIIHVAISIR